MAYGYRIGADNNSVWLARMIHPNANPCLFGSNRRLKYRLAEYRSDRYLQVGRLERPLKHRPITRVDFASGAQGEFRFAVYN